MKLDELKPLVQQLSAQEKAELVKELIGTDSGLQVVLGGSVSTSAEIVIQIQTASSVDISALLEALAYRVRNQKPESDRPIQSNGTS
ncbi:hypothetical protein [Coleofasciculus sp. FACHB-501]|uniref:hypothetical protein n=1 Tax=Cyanophyceae TaxID=3028117 RepID=UPI001688A2E0|nr:hypothetical protein [Coleofasciculus sp. FACHB-501]MBD1836656.1 hypothetical protein [Coleofasciculus sp. FACHB-501]